MRQLRKLPNPIGEPTDTSARLIRIRIIASTLLIVLLISACGGPDTPIADSGPPPSPDTSEPAAAPVPGQAPAATGTFSVEEASFRVAESFPIQVFLDVSGIQPTPCDEATWTVERVAGTVQVELYTVADPAATCIAALHPVDVVIPLGAFESGSWTVLLNGDELGTFEA